MARSNKKSTRQLLADLKPHPRQAEFFENVADPELDALADDMQRNGLQRPVEITSNNQIICGHRRVAAAKKLGWHEIEIVVRTDLEKQGQKAVERHFIEDNLNRQHLSSLQRARCIAELCDSIDSETDSGMWRSGADSKQKISQRLHLDQRSVNRYLAVLRSPRAVQQAFDKGIISLVVAGRVAQLNSQQQDEIASRIDDGEDPKEVIAIYLTAPAKKSHKPVDKYRDFLKLLKNAQTIAPSSAQGLSIIASEVTIALLTSIAELCRTFVSWEKDALGEKSQIDLGSAVCKRHVHSKRVSKKPNVIKS